MRLLESAFGVDWYLVQRAAARKGLGFVMLVCRQLLLGHLRPIKDIRPNDQYT